MNSVKEEFVIAPKGEWNYECELEMTFTLEGSRKFVDFGKKYLAQEKSNLEVLLIRVWIDEEVREGVEVQELSWKHGRKVSVKIPNTLWMNLTGIGKECMNQRLLDIVEMREKDWE
jgi:hypothetical protein